MTFCLQARELAVSRRLPLSQIKLQLSVALDIQPRYQRLQLRNCEYDTQPLELDDDARLLGDYLAANDSQARLVRLVLELITGHSSLSHERARLSNLSTHFFCRFYS